MDPLITCILNSILKWNTFTSFSPSNVIYIFQKTCGRLLKWLKRQHWKCYRWLNKSCRGSNPLSSLLYLYGDSLMAEQESPKLLARVQFLLSVPVLEQKTLITSRIFCSHILSHNFILISLICQIKLILWTLSSDDQSHRLITDWSQV